MLLFEIYRKLFAMLHGRERLYFLLLLVMITVSGVIDMIGVASILPFLSVLADPAVIDEQPRLAMIYDLLEPRDTRQFLFLLGIVIFVIIVLGTAFKLFTMYALARFSHMRRFQIGQRLLAGYLRQPYVWFVSRHSSELVKTVLQEVDQMVGSALVPALKILAQAVTILFLLVLLIVVEPTVALGALGAIGLSYAGIFLFVRRLMLRIGHDRVTSNTGRFRVAGEALNGIKDVKLMGLEENYMRAFRPPARAHARTLMTEQVVTELPRYALEALTFGGMIALILVLLRNSDGTLSGVLPILGLFAVAGLRMLPAVQNIYHSATQLRVGLAVLNVVHDDLLRLENTGSSFENPSRERLPLNDRIRLQGACYSYPDTEHAVLDELDLEIRAKSTVGIVGGTGAGKTTVIDVILGLLELDSGKLCIDGVELTRDRLRDWQNNIGYVPQQIFLTDDTVAANIAFGVPHDRIDMEAVERASRLANLHEFVTTQLKNGYHQMVGERGIRLSGGQKQRIGIARALYHDPEVLVFDEATSALDNITERAIMEAVASFSHSKTIIMIAHRLTTVEACDEIFLLERGRCVDRGTYTELVARNQTFRDMARGIS
jgi:ABC-type multidrug transport system fused ATPase/permease subunit